MKDPFEDASSDVGRRRATLILVAMVLGLVALAAFRPGTRDALAIVAGLVVMVMLHEAGHFFAARRAGMKATEFFLGFGPRLWSFRRGETEYGVKAVLLGGYVRIVGMTNVEEVEPADEDRTFRRGSFRHRMVVVLAGVTVNALLALLLFYVFFAAGGELPDGPSTTVARVVADSAADESGFREDDRIVAIDGRRVTGWEDLVSRIETRAGEPTEFTVVRAGERVELDASVGSRGGQGFLGIGPGTRYRSTDALGAVPESFDEFGRIVVGTATGLADLVSPEGLSDYGRNFTSDAPDPGSPGADARPRSIIGIVDVFSDIVDGDVLLLLYLLGALSLLLAFFNTLPLLPFDGGHAAVVGYEWIASKVKGREVRADYRRLMPMTAVVLAIFLTLGLSAMFLDIREAIGS